jgi:hypothetical protein
MGMIGNGQAHLRGANRPWHRGAAKRSGKTGIRPIYHP